MFQLETEVWEIIYGVIKQSISLSVEVLEILETHYLIETFLNEDFHSGDTNIYTYTDLNAPLWTQTSQGN